MLTAVLIVCVAHLVIDVLLRLLVGYTGTTRRKPLSVRPQKPTGLPKVRAPKPWPPPPPAKPKGETNA